MGIFQQFPYSNFHEMNLDQIIKIMREMQDEWAETKTEWASYKDFIDNYFANLNLDEETEKALRALIADGTLDPVIDPVIIAEVDAWLSDHITQPTTPAIDTSLSIAGAGADAKTTGQIVFDLMNTASYDYLYNSARSGATQSGITFAWTDHDCTITGTSSNQVFNNIFASLNSIPAYMTKGKDYYVEFDGENVEIEILQMTSGGGIAATLYRGYKGGWFSLPAVMDGLVIRLLVRNGVTVNETVHPRICNYYSNEKIRELIEDETLSYKGPVDFNTDLNTLGNGYWLLASSRNYSNNPLDPLTYGTLLCFKEAPNVTFQIAYAANNGNCYVRHWINNAYTSWLSIGGSGGGNNYTFNEYNNTYNVTATPTITSDSNSFLQATGDNTDVTTSIVTLLNNTGVCRLGKGDYYVNNLVMPDNTMIIGSGRASRIILKNTGDGHAIRMGSRCIVQDLTVAGSTSDISLSSVVTNRHGILWQGSYTQDQNSPQLSKISGVYIENFTGGGITCYDTGYGVANSIEVVNTTITKCNAGINISYFSEFNKFTNVKAILNYYGCINNGGNNNFVNCDFSGNKLGFLMDNQNNQSPNNSHGSVVGCLFNHSDANLGTGIRVLNCDNGYTFTGCQIFYSKIEIQNSDGIIVADSVFGQSNCNITISGGNTVLFANNMYQGAPTISVVGNTKVHFVNCYVRDTGALVSN